MAEYIKDYWKSKIKHTPLPKYSSGNILLDFSTFRDNVINNNKKSTFLLIDQLMSGNILILKNALSQHVTSKIKLNTRKFWLNNEDSFHKMIGGKTPNYHRAVNEEIAKKYSVKSIRHSAYLFPWNEDFLEVRKEIVHSWNIIKQFIGLDINDSDVLFSKEKIDRIHVILYPPKIGCLETHSDPYHNQLTFIGGLLSKRGNKNEYKEGGFYTLDKNKKQCDLENFIDEGDMIIGMATIKHGVDLIDPGFKEKINWYGTQGRWFLSLFTNDSDTVKNRITSIPKSK